ncbi:MAG: efflux RND transporter permease subunit, partial [bacterium]|nr:efflux RND transporter permease subunit [bacterium]
MGRRPIARLIASLGILLLGGVAAQRLDIAYLPSSSFPELSVRLRLLQGTDVADLTRRWIVPLEASIRAVGEVRGVAGEVNSDGGWFRVRLRPGTDAERKAARLESELSMLRRDLPDGANLSVQPAGQGAGEDAVLWLGDAGEDAGARRPVERSFVEAVRSLPEVRSVEVAGESLRELEVSPKDATGSAALRRAIARRLATRRLGETQAAGRRLPVLLRGPRDFPLGELPIRHGEAVLPLSALADLRLGHRDAAMVARLDGRRGRMLVIDREYEFSPLALERSLGRLLRDFGLEGRARLLINKAEPLRQLLERLAAGALVAILAAAGLAWILGGWRAALVQALALPVALAAALNAFRLVDIPLDVTTLPALAVALGCGLFFLALRSGPEAAVTAPTYAVSAALVPVTVALAGGALAPLLAAPARAFVVAQVAAVLALWILPLPPPAEVPPAGVARLLRFALRNPWVLILGAVTGTYALFVFFGTTLAPRPGSLSPSFGDLGVELRFAEGTTPAQAEEQIAVVESHLSGQEEITEHFSRIGRRWGVIIARVRPEARRLSHLRRLAARLGYQLNSVGASARVVPLAGGSRRNAAPLQFTDDIEDRAEADEASTFYRLILRSTDLEVLRATHARLVEKISTVKQGWWQITYTQIRSDWGSPSTRVELVPRAGVTPGEAARAVEALHARAAQPRASPLAGDGDLYLRVADQRSPRSPEDVPQRAELLGLQTTAAGTAFAPAALFEVREVLASPSVKRQAGRFVLPVTVQIQGSVAALRRGRLWDVYRSVRTLPLPAGCDLELPKLNPYAWGPDRLRLLGIAGAFPLLVLALAICRLNSIRVGLVAL